MSANIKWAVLASGTGSILAAMLKQELQPDLVVVDMECPAADIAREAGIEVLVRLREGKYNRHTDECDPDRIAYTIKLAKELKSLGIGLVVMAGWMSVFSADMFTLENFGGRVLNTHPALLPAFKGHRAVADALAAGVKVTGCTIHLATWNLDDGPILGQHAVRILPDDDEPTLHERIKNQERHLYAEIVRQILDGKLDLAPIWQDWLAKQVA